MDVHEWPAEHISEAADLGDELRGQLCTWCWARGEGRGSFRRARPNSSWLCIQRHFFVLASAQLRYPLVDTPYGRKRTNWSGTTAAMFMSPSFLTLRVGGLAGEASLSYRACLSRLYEQ